MFALLAGLFSQYRTYMLIGLVLAGILGTGVVYFLWSQSRLQDLAAQNATLTQQNEEIKASINALKADIQTVVKNTDAANTALNDIRDTAAKTKAKVMKHDISGDAQKHSKAVEKIINDATRKTIRQIEEESRND
jgi:organic radical activating enzyme